MNNLLRRLIRRRIINNKAINPVFGMFGIDAMLNDYVNDYIDFRPDRGRTLFEIAGYSETPEMRLLFKNIHDALKSTIESNVPVGGKVLDIGCGPGLFLKDFEGKYDLTGIDINSGMTEIAKETVPSAKFFTGHFLKTKFSEKFAAIYTVGVIVYFNKGQLQSFLRRMNELLLDGGIAFISYPHAYRKEDMSYPDFTYVNYSPSYIEKKASEYFEILYHKHVNGIDVVHDYDRSPVVNSKGFQGRTYQNSSVIILRKK